MTTDALLGRLRVLQRSLATAGFVSLILADVDSLIADIEKNGVGQQQRTETPMRDVFTGFADTHAPR